MVIILKSVKAVLMCAEVFFFLNLSLGPTKILPNVPFYVSFKPHLDATRCHQKAVNGILIFKFSWGGGGMPPNPPSTARRWRAPRLWHAIDMDYSTFRFKLKPPPPPFENLGSAPAFYSESNETTFQQIFFGTRP